MDKKYAKSIEFLLKNANPSIKLRVKKEILGEIDPKEEAELEAQIMKEPISVLIANCQKENGWLGNGFHGPNKNAGPYENQEVGTKYLAEKGVSKNNPVLKNPYPFQFGFWLRAVSGTPDWVRQSTTAYELLADTLDKDTLFDRIPDKTLKAFKQIMGREPNWRKKTSAKCDVTYAVLRACWPVLK